MNSFAFVCFCFVLGAVTVSANTGSILVRNEGGYVATFSVTYTLNGERPTVSSGDFTAGVSKEISIPDGASDIYLKVEEYWFIGSLTTIFTKSFSSPEQHCYKIWGTTLVPAWAEIDC